jgi:hypothetical protein
MDVSSFCSTPLADAHTQHPRLGCQSHRRFSRCFCIRYWASRNGNSEKSRMYVGQTSWIGYRAITAVIPGDWTSIQSKQTCNNMRLTWKREQITIEPIQSSCCQISLAFPRRSEKPKMGEMRRFFCPIQPSIASRKLDDGPLKCRTFRKHPTCRHHRNPGL